MLVLSRRAGESLFIDLQDTVDDAVTARDLFGERRIQVCLLSSGMAFCRLGVAAPVGCRIIRSELDHALDG